ncbi:hypothetical protein ACLOJK_026765 [Asimina triloba]
MDAIEIRREVRPCMRLAISFAKISASSYLEVRITRMIARNKIKDATEKESAATDAIENTSSAVVLSVPCRSSFPGMYVAVAKATVAMSAATSEHD